ncbi:MAG: hypothetical protein PHI53_00640 [Candidatus Pacebacteria bacterium]|nr:hypothetical protein [Candidatus Paceibacterota bacterium]
MFLAKLYLSIGLFFFITLLFWDFCLIALSFLMCFKYEKGRYEFPKKEFCESVLSATASIIFWPVVIILMISGLSSYFKRQSNA